MERHTQVPASLILLQYGGAKSSTPLIHSHTTERQRGRPGGHRGQRIHSQEMNLENVHGCLIRLELRAQTSLNFWDRPTKKC